VKRRRIKSADVQFVTLCPRGANRLPVLYKSDGHVEFDALHKFDEETGELLAVVYAPEMRDVEGDIASREVVRKMAHSFARNGAAIDIRHDGKPVGKDRAYVAETFVIQKGDARFSGWKDYSGAPVDVTDAWGLLVKVDDPALRKLYRSGWNGVSLFGPAELEIEKSDPVPDAGDLAKRMSGESEMKPEDVQKLIAENNVTLLDSIKKMLPAAPPAEKPAEKAGVVIKFDPTDAKAVQAHLAKLEAEKVDWTNPDAVKAHLAKLEAEKGEKPAERAADPEAEKLKKEIDLLNARLTKLAKSSTAPAADKAPVDPLKKEHDEQVAAGKSVAEIANRQRGFTK